MTTYFCFLFRVSLEISIKQRRKEKTFTVAKKRRRNRLSNIEVMQFKVKVILNFNYFRSKLLKKLHSVIHSIRTYI